MRFVRLSKRLVFGDVFRDRLRSGLCFWSFFTCPEGFWSDDSINGWSPYSRDTAEVSDVPGFELVTKKRTINPARCIVKEYAEVRVFAYDGLDLLSVADSQHQSVRGYAEVDGSGDLGGDKDHGGSGGISVRVQLQFVAVTSSETIIGETAPQTPGVVLSLASGYSKAMAGRLKKCQNAKDRTRHRF